MEHSFDVRIAKKYGIEEAIILNNIYFWIEKNKANNQHFYDGKYWTYNSKKAFADLFPYMNARQIDYAINNLVKNGLIEKGNYNKVGFDRTLWYSITELGYSILQNCEMDITKSSNASNKIVEPIPDINKQIINKDIKEIQKKEEKYVEIFDFWNSQHIQTHKKLTDEMKKAIDKALKTYSIEDIKTAIQRYGTIYNSNYYWHYQWRLDDFLKQKNALPDFLDEGSKWLNYKNRRKDPKVLHEQEYTQEDYDGLFDTFRNMA